VEVRALNFLQIKEQVVKVIWQQATSPPHMDGSTVLTRWC